jgi:ParB-like chromosome segregation protein Spo0J
MSLKGKKAGVPPKQEGEPLRIVMRDVADLIPYARNARTHSEAQVAQIAASIAEFGFTNPVLTHGDGILAGHGRVMAARKLGMDTVPTIDLSHLTKTQARAYILADNQLALNAGWEAEMLSVELAELEDEGFNLDLLGFDNLDVLLDAPKEPKAAKEESLKESFSVLVDCPTEQAQAELLERLDGEGYKCRSLIS